VIAYTLPVTATIGGLFANVTITPTSLDFGTVQSCSQDNNATNGPIVINPDSSNTNISIQITDVTPGLFENIELETSNATWVSIKTLPTFSLPCNPVNQLCTFTPKSVNARLDVPCSIISGAKTGDITYTITATTP
jgi:hypothetical protein